MKRFLVCFVALITVLCSCAIADDGCYVPSYKTFMGAFVSKATVIESDLAEAILEKCFVNGIWEENEYSLTSYDSGSRIYFDFDKGNGFLNSFTMEISKDKIGKYEEVFKELMLAAATSIITDADEAFEQSFFDNIFYEYTKESPAGYITMYWNCGVYLFKVNKSSGDITFEISLSVYEANE